MDQLGVSVGHWTNAQARTGCTVAIFPRSTVASGEVRGGAPASRETDLLDPTRANAGIDAVLLTGGSAFGLASADGVMRWLEEQGRGVPTPAGPVPIVPTLGLFDLPQGRGVRPGPDEGYAACQDASLDAVLTGPVGAGAGCTYGQWRGTSIDAGLVSATLTCGEVVVSVLIALNAFGEPGPLRRELLRPQGFPIMFQSQRFRRDPEGESEQGSAETTVDFDVATVDKQRWESEGGAEGFGTNTTIGLVATNAALDKVGCHLLAQGAHDGLAQAVAPTHTRFDGDAFVAAATGEVEANIDVVRSLTVEAVAEAIGSLGSEV
ncbi:P1 family peptidase [Natronoglycomyces albus]|uniref:P1 family peptidase n=1 Tax=Natronoglycomyces albus TaxID=2811108 RepID=A0A895XI52_9ACTN|nr:P1 family peptidase [Natronoglycomyces albus]QSB05014.1 P1 family peptidase [Natronoglycomyces albus]